jgi:hypothetical protein
MVGPSRRRRKPLRLLAVPLPEDHPDWLELDRELPKDHLARRIRWLVEQLDLSELFDSFAGVGSPLTPPDLLLQVVLFNLQRQQLCPAEWFRSSRESLPVRWLLRGLRPARAVFYRFAEHLPEGLLDGLNAQFLSCAQAEGHTTASAAALDGTFHAAAGSRHHLLNLDGLDQRCALLDAAAAAADRPGAPTAAPAAEQALPPPCPAPAAGGAGATGAAGGDATSPTAAAAAAAQPGAVPTQPPGWMARSQAGRQRQRQRYEQARQTLRARLADHERKQRRQRKAKRRQAAQVKIAPNEPEAVLGKDKMKVFRPLYNTQILQDVDSPFVLGYGVYATVSDAGLLPPLLERGRQLTGRGLEEVLVDRMYARLLDARYCAEHQVRLYAPLPAPSQQQAGLDKDKGAGKGAEKPLGKEAFRWLEAEHTYQCPQGHLLHLESRAREGRRDGEQVVVEQYRCAAQHCQGCPLAGRCTKRPDKGRTVKRLEGQELLDAVGERPQTAQGKQRYRQRSQSVERLHADFRAHRGLQRFPRYGLRQAQSLIALLVLAHNGLALLKAREAKKAKLQEACSPP